MRLIPVVIFLAVSCVRGDDVFDRLSVVDDWNAPMDARESAINDLAQGAKDHPLICVELARRVGVTLISAPIKRVFEDPSQYCERMSVPVIRVLRGTDSDMDVHYVLLSKEQLQTAPGFVKDTLSRYVKYSQGATLASLVARYGLTEYTETIVTAVIEAQWLVGERIEDRRSISSEVRTQIWEEIYAVVLLRLRTDRNAGVVDEALNKIRESLESLQRMRANQGKTLWADEQEVLDELTSLLKPPPTPSRHDGQDSGDAEGARRE